MTIRPPSEVARRCLCLELLLQRVGLELDDEDHVDRRDAFRKAWVSRLGDLGLDNDLLPDERDLLLRTVDELTQEEVGDIEGRVIGAVVLLWSLDCVQALPTVATLADAADMVAENGFLGDGSVSGARNRANMAKLRPESVLHEAWSAATELRGDVSSSMTKEQMVAGISVRALSWVLGAVSSFDVAETASIVATPPSVL